MSTRTRSALAAFTALLAGLATAVVLTAQPRPAAALTGSQFHAGNIISDTVFYNSTAMTAAQVQTFLDSKVTSCQAGYTCLPQYTTATTSQPAQPGLCNAYTGKPSETAAQIIANVAIACSINPQVLIALLQKEQRLVTSTAPSAYNYNYAAGANCPDSTGCSSGSAGFFKQVYLAAYQFQYYRAHPDYYNYLAGRNNYILYNPNTKCGGSQVYIENEATASLYIYTPYQPNAAALANLTGTGDKCSSYGNRNFWYFFNSWFSPAPTPHSAGGLVAVRTDGTLWYYPNTGNAAQPFTNGTRIGISGWNKLTHVVAGDVDGDGLSDLVGTRADGSLWLYRNDGSSLPYPTRLRISASGWNAFSMIALGDVTGDGLADLVALKPNGTLWLYPNTGNPTQPFKPRVQIGSSGWTNVTRLVLGDIDGDGLADIVVTHADGSLWLYRNTGSATRPYTGSVQIGAGGWQHFGQLVLSDVNSDGRADLVAARSDGTLWLYPNAAGQARPFGARTEIGLSGWQQFSTIVATDVPVPRRATSGDLLATQPSGTLSRFATNPPAPYGSGVDVGHGWQVYSRVVLADVDGDGRADLVAVKPDGTLWLYRNTGNPARPYSGHDLTQIGKSGWQKLTLLVAADVDGDGRADLVATRADGSLWLYPNSGDPADPYTSRVRIGASGWGQYNRLLAADVDGDGKADLIATRPDGSLARYLNTGSSTRPYKPRQDTALTGWQDYQTLAAADVDGDGRADLVATRSDGSLWLDQDAGSDRFPHPVRIATSGWSGFTTLLAGDVTSSTGPADLLALTSSGQMRLYRNNGTAAAVYTTPTVLGSTGWQNDTQLSRADVDGDGRPDLVGVQAPGTLWLYRNSGNPSAPYAGASPVMIGKSGWQNYDRLVAADVNGDGYADLIGRKPDGTLWLYQNTRDTSRPFTGTKTQIDTGWQAYTTFVAADVNGDGLPDLIALKPDGTLWLYLNSHDVDDPYPTATQIGSGLTGVLAMAAGDIDTGGGAHRADIVVSLSDGSLWLYRNTGDPADPFPAKVQIASSGWQVYDRLLL